MSRETATGRLRIDDLAQRSGIASGTIRFYQREGLIPPPQREGRVAYYSEEHLRRLERVRALQAKGLPLGVVGDILEREDAGEDASSWLALDSAVFGRRDPVDTAALERELRALLVAAGIPRSGIDAGSEVVTSRLREIAEAMAELGWEAFAAEREQISADQPVAEDVLARFQELRSLAQRIVTTLFPQLLDEAIRARSEPFAEQAVARRRGRR